MVLGSKTGRKRQRAVPAPPNARRKRVSAAIRTYNAAMQRAVGSWDSLIAIADQGLRTVSANPAAHRPSPAAAVAEAPLSADERAQSAALMRVNRAGEIAAQALYLGQALFARTAVTRRQLLDAAAEESDHLAWCTERLIELGGRKSYLDPIWYAGGTGLGRLAEAVVDAADKPNAFEPVYPLDAPISAKIEAIATRVYGADGIFLLPAAEGDVKRFTELGLDTVPICMAKTHL